MAANIDNHRSDEKDGSLGSSVGAAAPGGARELDERRRAALSQVDNATFSWFHVKVCCVAGVGFFTDAYDIFAINIASQMLGYLYGHNRALNVNQDLGVKVATPIGNLFGQLLFGWLADVLGHGVELMIIIVATFGQAISGESATGWGNLAAALVSLILVQSFKNKIIHDNIAVLKHVDYCWRLLIGLGCVPDPDAAVQRVQAPKATRRDFLAHFGKWENGKVLLGTAYSWPILILAMQIAFYGLGLNSSIVLTTIGFGTSPQKGSLGIYQSLHNVSVGNIILSVGGLIPGYWASFLLIDSWGRKPIQLMGFIVLTVLFVIMGFGYDALTKTHTDSKYFVFLYCLANFFQNFGPNVTTFVIPGEVSPPVTGPQHTVSRLQVASLEPSSRRLALPA
ncbi:hypothetical protein BJV77DRAFT_963930 [Russula vinacea]|nr:hypothetical protein BJV77DRAFT_963930 [Russula vinacea]